LDININHIPFEAAHNRRPNIKQKPLYITIHSTGNAESNAEGERGWLTNPDNYREASWHYCVDGNSIVEAIPPNEVAWHAGDGNGKGNRASISIEICESGDRKKTLELATKLVAYLMKKHNIKLLKRHYDWSGKVCPRIFYDKGKWLSWEAFKDDCMKAYTGTVEASKGTDTKDTIKSNMPAQASYKLPTGTYKLGSKGSAVKKIQTALNKLYFKCGKADGIWGAKTDDALRRFQMVHLPYEVDGVYGKNTRNAMLKQLNK
jgi:N-acetylmuramoyl-L-alanine amidase